MILVIDNYDSFTWNLVHYIEELGMRTRVVRNDAISVEEIIQSPPSALLLSPGPCSPDEAGICLELIKRAPHSLPMLGVCLGHQAIGQAYGGKVIGAKEIRHGKLSNMTHTGGDLFSEIPENYEIVRYHSLSLSEPDLPNVFSVDARTADGEIMAISHKSKPIYGVQFHPESIKTEHGHALLQNFLKQVPQ